MSTYMLRIVEILSDFTFIIVEIEFQFYEYTLDTGNRN